MASQSLLQSNLDTLKRLNRPLADWLSSQSVNLHKIEKRLMRNRWGLLDWSLPAGKGMFEAIHPKNIYQNWAVKKEDKPAATIIVGCNLGFGLTYLLANTPASDKLLVIEPNPEMVMVCLSQTDYRPFLEAQRLFFLPPDATAISDTVFNQLDLYFEFGQIQMRVDIPSQQLGPEYAQWFQSCKEILDDFRLDMNTIRGQQDTLIRNELDNFNRAIQDGSLNLLKNQAKGLTAVQLGAGPSLEQFAPIITKDPGSALLIAAFQSLPALQKYHLKPHLCMLIDPTPVMKNIYERVNLNWIKDIPLVYSCKALPEVVDAYPGPTLPMWTKGGLGSNIWNDIELVLNTGANVGIAVTRFLAWCGVSKILLVGQDFAWSGEKVHAAETAGRAYAFQRNPEKVRMLQNRQGEEICSNAVYVTALRELEKEIEALNIPVFNLYGGFAIIHGTQEVTWNEVLSRNILASEDCSLGHFIFKLDKAKTPVPRPVVKEQTARWQASLNSVQKTIEKLCKEGDNNQQEIYSILNELLLFMNQDALYRTYLINEIFRISGMLFTRKQIGLKEFDRLKQIFKQILSKVREIDQKLATSPKETTHKIAT